MLEVCFSDSMKGALIYAQNGRNTLGGAMGVIAGFREIFAEPAKRKALRAHRKRQRALQKQAIPLGGKREDVVCVALVLSEGDVRAAITPGECPRKAHVRAALTSGRPEDTAETETVFSAFWKDCMEAVEKLKARPDRVRIWLDRTPDAQCGLLFTANLLKNSATEIRVVELPDKVWRDDHCVVRPSEKA